MVSKTIAQALFVVACFFIAIGGCALDSESLAVPTVLIMVGAVIAFIGICIIENLKWR